MTTRSPIIFVFCAFLFSVFFLSPIHAATSNTCNLPAAQQSTLSVYAAKRSFNTGTIIHECYKSTLSAEDKTRCLTTLKNEYADQRVAFQVAWRDIEPTQGQINWQAFDEEVNFARANGIKLQFHHLIWSNHKRYTNPARWLFPGRTEMSCGTRTKAELEQILQNHFRALATRGGDTITAWNVVNEAFEPDGSMVKDCFYTILGSDYIDKMFRYARETNPNATLVLNEFFTGGNTFRSKVNGFFAYVRAAKTRGVPIDAVGLQNHQLKQDGYQFTNQYMDDIAYFFQKAREANSKVMITEMDVYQAGRTQEQVAKVYKDTLAFCLKEPLCISFAVWGISDKFSWSRGTQHANLPDSKPVLFDEQYQRKPAYYAVMDALRESTTRPCVSVSPTPTKTPTPTPTRTPTPTMQPTNTPVRTPTPSHTPAPSNTPTRTPTPTPNPADINGDGHVTILDYNIVVAAFNTTGVPGFTPADIIKNGSVDIFDYNMIVRNYNK